MKFIMTYSELLARTYIVDADTYYDAVKKMQDAVWDENLYLTTDDYVSDSGEIDGDVATDMDMTYPNLDSLYE